MELDTISQKQLLQMDKSLKAIAGFSKNGFSLVVTVVMMVLLSLIAVALLSLSSIVLRSSAHSAASDEARANARLALMLALGELQKAVGPDQRITADADILSSLGKVAEPRAVGVWKSWSPRFAAAPTQSDPNYNAEHESRFVRWLVSGRDRELERQSWVNSGATGSTIALFRKDNDGFDLRAQKVAIDKRGGGELAWAVSQEATKAKVSVAGEEKNGTSQPNDKLHAQLRPTLGLSQYIDEPRDDNWNKRASLILDLKQLELDADIWKGRPSRRGMAHFTTSSFGLMTDVVNGGFKTDMNLGFELSDSDFRSSRWSADQVTLPNPFHGENSDFTIPPFYKNQRTLYAHLGTNLSGNYTDKNLLGSFDIARAQFEFPIYCAPTYDLLRSHYRTYKNVFSTPSGPGIFERTMDHVAGKSSSQTSLGFYPTPALYMDGVQTQTGYKPVLDRSIFIVSSYVTPANQVAFMFTPVVTMWNPYNVSLEIEGAVTYIWVDIPFRADWSYYQGGTFVGSHGQYFSISMGSQFFPVGGRQVNPYFYGAITATGAAIGSGSNPTIAFEPGEVRMFVPASTQAVSFDRYASIRARTLFMKPVESAADLTNLDGGIYVPQTEARATVPNEAEVEMVFQSVTGEDYPFFITLEDATRAKGVNPTHENSRGNPIADVLARYFGRSGQGANAIRYTTPRISVATLRREPYPLVVMETYHRPALQTESTGALKTDIVYTNNPRQPWMTDKVTNFGTDGGTGPQYQTRIKALSGVFSNFLGGFSGRNTFYGATNDASKGRTHLSFFEAPTTPMLSLAGFQHCDMSSTTAATAYQFANSWPSAHVRSNRVAVVGRQGSPTMIDHSYLINEALWDSFFFSGAAPYTQPGSASAQKGKGFWNDLVAQESRSLNRVVEDFVKNPEISPLRNPRMKLYKGGKSNQELTRLFLAPAGPAVIGAHLLFDGPFNVNSTSVEAWQAVLGSLRDSEFKLAGGDNRRESESLQSRFQHPVGHPNDIWHGFRTLSDEEVKTLAQNIVREVQNRGPFLSLAEFVNRRIDDNRLPGVIQSAIDNTILNKDALQDTFDTRNFDRSASRNINPADTGVGIPGYLTQADVLQSMAPVMTVRSDTFTIRSYGAARDNNGRILATAYAEAVVQRVPDFVEPNDPAFSPVPRQVGTSKVQSDISPINEALGRKFKVISFRYLSRLEAETPLN